MAPFEFLWPNELHVPPTAVAYAVAVLIGRPVLTSSIALACWRGANGLNADKRNTAPVTDCEACYYSVIH